MSYALEALIAPQATFEKFIIKRAKIISLTQGFSMFAFETGEYLKFFKQDKPQWDPENEEDSYPGPIAEIEELALALSQGCTVAHIDILCWGGEGTHAGSAWENGKRIYGPSASFSGSSFGTDLQNLPSNLALRAIGVLKLDSDEFDALGLGRFR